MFCARNGMWGKWGKGVEKKFPNIVWNILGNQCACLLHAVFLHFVVECLAVDGKQLGSLALVAVGGSQGSGDAFLFRLFAVQLHIDWSGCGGLCHRLLQFLAPIYLPRVSRVARFITLFSSRRLPASRMRQ